MPLSYTWNAAWEALPGTGLSRNSLDDHLRRIALGVRQRMEREHNFGPNNADDGTHIEGKTTVLLTGNAAARAGVSNMQEGGLFLQNDGTNLELFLYTSSAWLSITNDVHANMDSLGDDLAHEQYMLKDGIYDESTTVDMNDQVLSTLVAAGVPLVADHPFDDDPHSVAAYTALVNDDIGFVSALDHTAYLVQYSGIESGGVAAGTRIVQLPANTRAIVSLKMRTSDNIERWTFGAVPNAGFPHVAFHASTGLYYGLYWILIIVVGS